MHRAFAPLLLSLTACGAPTESSPPVGTTPTNPGPVAPFSAESWRAEDIEFPPVFAPGLPPGQERVLFAPGMFDVDAPDYWSYTFVIRVEEQGYDAARLTDFFEQYYDGLIVGIADTRELEVPPDPATVRVESSGRRRFDGTVDLVDAFTDGRMIRVNLRMHVVEGDDGSTMLRVRASPQPDGHAIWDQLMMAMRTLNV
ncbi:MAG: hypothetical protein AAF957_08040 [Planctomycetota bacterium]